MIITTTTATVITAAAVVNISICFKGFHGFRCDFRVLACLVSDMCLSHALKLVIQLVSPPTVTTSKANSIHYKHKLILIESTIN